jgi:hypothetical protein
MPPVTPATIAMYVALIAAIVGLVVRDRWRLSVFFSAYTVALLITALEYVWPQQFCTQAFWILTQALQDILKIGIVLEIAWKTFRAFPGTASAIRHAVLTLLLATIVAAITTPLANAPTSSYTTALVDFHPRVMDGTIWMIAVALGVAWFYRVPMHPFHRAVLTTVAIYTACFSTLLRLLGRYDLNVYLPYVHAVNSVVALVVCARWLYVIWTPVNAANQAHERTMRKLDAQVPSLFVTSRHA